MTGSRNEARQHYNLPPKPLDTQAFFDVVRIRLAKKPRNTEIKELKRRNKGRVKFPRQINPVVGFPCVIALQQPTTTALKYLASLAKDRNIDHYVSYVEFALDVILRDSADANTLGEYVLARLIQPWFRGDIRLFDHACYFGARKWGRQQLVLYWDRPSKIHGTSCVHIEFRVSAKAPLRRLRANTLTKLIKFDHREFWKIHLRLEEVDLSALGKQRCGRGRAKKSEPKDLRIGAMLATATEGTSPGIKSQEIRNKYRGCDWFHPETCMIRIDNTQYLP